MAILKIKITCFLVANTTFLYDLVTLNNFADILESFMDLKESYLIA